MNPFRALYRTWFTGALCLVAMSGYVFYALLFVLRMIQRSRILIAVCVLLTAASVGVVLMFVPLGEHGSIVEVTVGPGESVRTVAGLLERRRVVPSAGAFLLWVKLRGIDRNMQAGEYIFYEREGILSAGRKLLAARPIELSFTVPEGLTIEQTARKVAEQVSLDTAVFIGLCRDSKFAEELGASATSLEGYLFPDTYRMAPGASAREIIRRMFAQFRQVYGALRVAPAGERYSQHEIVTLASIVEKEASLAPEQTHIAGVFHNRLERGWALGADPTVRYALKKFSGPLRVSELKNPSPYNTRIHAGLPPGPICSPGRGAIAAALAPLETRDLYFVAKWDGSGAHDFSASNAEHDRKKLEIRRENERRKRTLRSQQGRKG